PDAATKSRKVAAYAFVTDKDGRPFTTGKVQFKVNGTNIGGLVAPSSGIPGVYAATLPVDAPDESTIRAEYSDTLFGKGASSSVTIATAADPDKGEMAPGDMRLELPRRDIFVTDKAGDRFVAVVRANTASPGVPGTGEIQGVQFEIRYDPASYSYAGIEKGKNAARFGNVTATDDKSDGLVKFMTTLSQPTGETTRAADAELFLVSFDVKSRQNSDGVVEPEVKTISAEAVALIYDAAGKLINLYESEGGGRAMKVFSREGETIALRDSGLVNVSGDRLMGLVASLSDSAWTDWSNLGADAPSVEVSAHGIRAYAQDALDVTPTAVVEAPSQLDVDGKKVALSSSAEGFNTASLEISHPSFPDFAVSIPVQAFKVGSSGGSWKFDLKGFEGVAGVSLGKVAEGIYQRVQARVLWTAPDGTEFDATDRVTCVADPLSIKTGCLVAPTAVTTAPVEVRALAGSTEVARSLPITVTDDTVSASIIVGVVGSLDNPSVDVPPSDPALGLKLDPAKVDGSVSSAKAEARAFNKFIGKQNGPIVVLADYGDGKKADITDEVVGSLKLEGGSVAQVLDGTTPLPEVAVVRPGVTKVTAAYAGKEG
ncbi:MAG TPA: cohesin domain-containing protein, partial [bacterium]|nr:cohesin domain-containing protein [bacterium]